MSQNRMTLRSGWLALAVLLLGLAGWLLMRVPPGLEPTSSPRNAPASTSPAPAAGNQPLPGATNRSSSAARRAEAEGTARHGGQAPNAAPTGRAIRLVAQTLDTSIDSPAGAAPAGLDRLLAAHPGRATWIVQLAGPVRQEWKDALAAAGLETGGYVPDHAFAVRGEASALRRAAALPFVRWIGPYDAAYRIAPALYGATGSLRVEVCTFAPADVAAAAEIVGALGGDVLGRKDGPRFGRVRARIDAALLPKLASSDRVQWIEPYREVALFNEKAVGGSRLNVTNVWTTHGLNGSNQIVAVADTGLDNGTMTNILADFAGRVLLGVGVGRPNQWNDPHSHGTHVCGSVLGDGTLSGGLYRGVAWRAQLIIQSLHNASGGLTLPADLGDLFLNAYTNGARIHSDSWGSSTYGFYSTQSRDVDEFVWDHPDMLIAFAASNDGADDSADGVVDGDSIGSPATAKNCLTVGAAENDRAEGGGTGLFYALFGGAPVPPLRFDNVSAPYDGVNQGLATFSSRGPCDDGRIKPDIVAPGTDVISTRSRDASGTLWGVAPDPDYLFSGGTSMATPLAAGCAALFRQYLVERRGMTNPSAALIKAAMIAGARSLSPGQYGTDAYREIPPLPRPNNAEGWGQIDVEGTLFPAAPLTTACREGAPLATGATNALALNIGGAGPLRVALAWSDFPAASGSSKQLVNDLDLRVIAPNGLTFHPNGAAGPDRTNNVETIDLDVSAGDWRVEVVGANVPQGPQPYALVLRGPLAPTIVHVPHPNTTNTVDAYAIDATITSPGLLDTNQLAVFWNADGSQDFAALPMVRVSGDVFRASIPAQPLFARVQYYLSAATNGLLARDPADAPMNVHAFDVTTPVTLSIGAWPVQIGAVSPAYGVGTYASGNVVQVAAPAFAWTPSLLGYTCIGWAGIGSAPASGTTNEMAVTLTENTTVIWQWQFASYGLRQTSTPAGAVDALTWWAPGSTGTTVTAPASAILTGALHRFAGWWRDGARVPDATSSSPNPAAGLAMTTSHTATAVYVPAAQDLDGDGLMDWWELLHFGGTAGAGPTGDDDGDGYRNSAEFSDETNPRDALSRPVPPVILHTPLAALQTQAAPFTVTATVTDNFAVASVSLWWQRNSEPWSTAAMTNTGGAQWSAAIPAPGTNFDVFTYFLIATDPGGRAAIDGYHTFDVGYPVLAWSPGSLGTNWLAVGTTGFVALAVSNAGAQPLVWTAAVETVHIDNGAEGANEGWSVSGPNAQWHPSTYRPYSGSNSWYCGSDIIRRYFDAEDARLLMPGFTPGPRAVLTFQSWLKCELDNGILAWDGGVIEVSTNGGATFFSVEPVGGYPYQITPNDDSPFPYYTPCLAGTGGWQKITVDLAAFENVPLLVRFRFGSDHYTIDEGWYIDDVLIVSEGGANTWLGAAPTAGTNAALAAQNLLVTLNAAAVSTGDYRGRVRLASNDADQPVVLLPIGLNVRHAPTVHNLVVTPRTDGSGWIAATQTVADADTASLSLRLEYSVDAGLTWTGGWLTATSIGDLDHGSAWSLSGVVTGGVEVIWSTTNAPAIAQNTATLARVFAFDGHLTSAAAVAGPFLVDNVPPSASGAVLSARSPFGDYVIGPTAVCYWAGFTDTGAGLAGYYLARSNGGGTTNGQYVASSPAEIGGLAVNNTNSVFVWARDLYGNIGAAVEDGAVPLAPQDDADGDGYSNGDEEIAGTSATNATSVLRLDGPMPGTRPVVRWIHVTNRVYTLQFAAEAGGPVDAVLTNPPVEFAAPYALFALTNAPGTSPVRQIRLGVAPP